MDEEKESQPPGVVMALTRSSIVVSRADRRVQTRAASSAVCAGSRAVAADPTAVAFAGRPQTCRSVSAVRFHCATLSEIIRVDFIAAWLSCA